MAVSASQEDRIVRRELVEVLPGRELRRFPESLDPTAASDPFVALGFCDSRFHLRQKIFERVRAFQVQRQLALADSEDVTMRIGQARHQRFAAKINGAGIMK